MKQNYLSQATKQLVTEHDKAWVFLISHQSFFHYKIQIWHLLNKYLLLSKHCALKYNPHLSFFALRECCDQLSNVLLQCMCMCMHLRQKRGTEWKNQIALHFLTSVVFNSVSQLVLLTYFLLIFMRWHSPGFLPISLVTPSQVHFVESLPLFDL